VSEVSNTPSVPNGGSRPRLLDLFCGAGGAAMGYHRAGFEVVGVDIRPQPNYPFEFCLADALDDFGRDLARRGRWDAIHASPPCQLFSAYQRANKRQGEHLNLIPETRRLLRETGLPYIIENVPGAPLEEPVTVCGVSVGLEVRRHRLFESNVDLMVPPCACGGWQAARHQAASNREPNSRRTVAIGEWDVPEGVQQRAMGIEWMTVSELSQAIPPAYTEMLGSQLITSLAVAA
jgi:DNA (cytosine-5)-methyltransferase 1